ncbi:nucleoside 2-deoxyribosyltransferase domain-containing protein [Lachnospiraceae bacterium OttesenSCG-928-E19]|nr:nucleoside 2-deoxyribosyltransferase domain-containing protein [Lachnospiraceae bacterium OttesenSCG-928-E19]
MKIYNPTTGYDNNTDHKSVFLAGPTYRIDKKNPYDFNRGWRADAVKYFQELGFDGAIYIPEPMPGNFKNQIDWENHHLARADVILFWIPRDLKILPGFTTNVEFGEWLKSGKIVLGSPRGAEKMRYLIHRAKQNNVPVTDNLMATVRSAIELIKTR